MKQFKTHFAATLCVLFLLLAFLCSAMAALVMGVQSESSQRAFSARTFSERTLMAYLAEKLRQSDGDNIYLGEFDGTNALIIESVLKNISYTDIIYSYDGALFELFCKKGAGFSRIDGTKLLEVGSVIFSEPKSGLIYIEATDTEGKTSFLHLFLRSGGRL